MDEKVVLLVAFHFPPAAMSSGHLRTLAFAKYLPEFGWSPLVLSARRLAYPSITRANLATIPQGVPVHRAWALDAGRHLAIGGKYPGFLAQPDRWISWWPDGVRQGLRAIRRRRAQAIWSTYPIMSAHCIAHTLSHLARVPWIADFRDPIRSSVAADNRFAVASQLRWEQRVLRSAACVTFTTPGACCEYAERYPAAASAGRLAIIANGYDETQFAHLAPSRRRDGDAQVWVHSGLLYPDGRDPRPFFAALAKLKSSGVLTAGRLQVVLRASGFEAGYAGEIARLGVDDMVTLAPAVPNHDALVEQASADALLLFQGSRFNRQVPAKMYEYLRIGRPILALVDADGDTAATLRTSGGAIIAAPDDVDAIAGAVQRFAQAVADGHPPRADPGIVARYSRRAGAEALAKMLDRLTAHKRASPRQPAELV